MTTPKGIVLEVSPLVGASMNQIESLYALLQRLLPEGSIVQCLLYASPHIGEALDRLVLDRKNHHPVTEQLIQQRVAFYREAAFHSLIAGQQVVVRDFRVLMTLVLDNSLDLSEDKLLSLKNTLIGSLKGMGLFPRLLNPEAFLAWMDSLLRPSEDLYDKPNPYSDLDLLSTQVVRSEVSHTLTPSKIFVSEGETQTHQIRNYRVSQFKESVQLNELSDLIGNLFDPSTQIGCPFVLSLILQIAEQSKEQELAYAKAFRARQRAEKIARISPQAVQEATMARGIIQAIEEAERLVNVSFQVTLYARHEEMASFEAALFNVFQASSLKWQLAKNNLLQMVMLLAHLPLAQSAGLFKSLKTLGVLYKVWSQNAANMLPLLAEMKGMESPRLLFSGRR